MPHYRILPNLERYLAGQAQGSIPLIAAEFEAAYNETAEKFHGLVGRSPPRAVFTLLMEGLSNGYSAAYRWALMRKSGLTYEQVLALKKGPADAPVDIVRRAEQAMGSLERAHVRERWVRLGLMDPPPCWVEVDADDARERWSVSVCNRGRPCDEDLREVQRRTEDPQGVRRQIDVLREQYRHPDGRVSIPGTTGGGALGVLHIITAAMKDSLRLEFRATETEPPVTKLTVHGVRQELRQGR